METATKRVLNLVPVLKSDLQLAGAPSEGNDSRPREGQVNRYNYPIGHSATL